VERSSCLAAEGLDHGTESAASPLAPLCTRQGAWGLKARRSTFSASTSYAPHTKGFYQNVDQWMILLTQLAEHIDDPLILDLLKQAVERIAERGTLYWAIRTVFFVTETKA
jgi:hypothetical protein